MSVAPPSDLPVEDGDLVRPRQCGRCQKTFPGDPALHRTAQLGWWMCPPCREALLGPGKT